MNILVLYDSLYGNTKEIALAVQAVLSTQHNSQLRGPEEMSLQDLQNIDLLVVGSPTHGGRAKPSLQAFLDRLPDGVLKGISFAVFDTRFLEKDQGFALQLLMKTIGYAAPKIAQLLTQKGGLQITDPEGFIVLKKQGPLAENELDRVKIWAEGLLKGV